MKILFHKNIVYMLSAKNRNDAKDWRSQHWRYYVRDKTVVELRRQVECLTIICRSAYTPAFVEISPQVHASPGFQVFFLSSFIDSMVTIQCMGQVGMVSRMFSSRKQMAADWFTCEINSEFPNQRGCSSGVVFEESIKCGLDMYGRPF